MGLVVTRAQAISGIISDHFPLYSYVMGKARDGAPEHLGSRAPSSGKELDIIANIKCGH